MLSLGVLRPGESSRGSLTLRNERDKPITIAKIESSCPCLSASPASLRVEAQDEARLIVSFDSADDPEYRGKLGIEVTGHDADGRALFQSRVDVEVRDGDPAVSEDTA